MTKCFKMISSNELCQICGKKPSHPSNESRLNTELNLGEYSLIVCENCHGDLYEFFEEKEK